MSYTAGFHGLLSYLALEGHSIFGNFAWAEKKSDGDLTCATIPDELKLITALLKENNTWCFKGQKRSHKLVWNELYQLFCKKSFKIPSYYYDLFDYLYKGRQKEKIYGAQAIKERFNNPALYEANKLKLEDAKEDFVNRISETRHSALYGARGFDPKMVEAYLNKELPSLSGIESHAEKFYSFSEAMIKHVTSDILDLISKINPVISVKRSLFICVYVTRFDVPITDLIPNKEIKDNIIQIEQWLSIDNAL